MDPQLAELLVRARQVEMTDAERQTQRLNFAYGNTRLENDSITRETVRRASKRLADGPEK